MAAKIKKGDTVEITTGSDRGKRGAVLRIDRERERVVVERLNIVKKHQKPTRDHALGRDHRQGSAAAHLERGAGPQGRDDARRVPRR